MVKPGGRLVVPAFCHDETVRSRVASRLLALTGFPGQRRFTLTALLGLLESARLEPTRMELIPGLIPIGYIEGSFG